MKKSAEDHVDDKAGQSGTRCAVLPGWTICLLVGVMTCALSVVVVWSYDSVRVVDLEERLSTLERSLEERLATLEHSFEDRINILKHDCRLREKNVDGSISESLDKLLEPVGPVALLSHFVL